MPRPMPATHQLQQPENSLDGRRDGQCHVWSSGQAGSLCVYHVYQFPCWFTQSLPNDHASVRSSCNVLLGDLGYNDSGIVVSNKIRKKWWFHHHLPQTMCLFGVCCPCHPSYLWPPQTLWFHPSALNPTSWWFLQKSGENSTSWGRDR